MINTQTQYIKRQAIVLKATVMYVNSIFLTTQSLRYVALSLNAAPSDPNQTP